MMADSTNIEDFKKFVELMAENFVPHIHGGAFSAQDSAGDPNSNEPSDNNDKGKQKGPVVGIAKDKQDPSWSEPSNRSSSSDNNKLRPYLIMDNHSSHRSPESAELLDEHFTPLWQPTYSSPFNCQETVWA